MNRSKVDKLEDARLRGVPVFRELDPAQEADIQQMYNQTGCLAVARALVEEFARMPPAMDAETQKAVVHFHNRMDEEDKKETACSSTKIFPSDRSSE
jgi:hypothetical protein